MARKRRSIRSFHGIGPGILARSVYRRDFALGQISLGGNSGTVHNANYTVIIVGQSAAKVAGVCAVFSSKPGSTLLKQHK
jgi:hypothetical protein